MRSKFTGIKDLDQYIFLKVDEQTLYNLHLVFKNLFDDTFWRNRTLWKFSRIGKEVLLNHISTEIEEIPFSWSDDSNYTKWKIYYEFLLGSMEVDRVFIKREDTRKLRKCMEMLFQQTDLAIQEDNFTDLQACVEDPLFNMKMYSYYKTLIGPNISRTVYEKYGDDSRYNWIFDRNIFDRCDDLGLVIEFMNHFPHNLHVITFLSNCEDERIFTRIIYKIGNGICYQLLFSKVPQLWKIKHLLNKLSYDKDLPYKVLRLYKPSNEQIIKMFSVL